MRMRLAIAIALWIGLGGIAALCLYPPWVGELKWMDYNDIKVRETGEVEEHLSPRNGLPTETWQHLGHYPLWAAPEIAYDSICYTLGPGWGGVRSDGHYRAEGAYYRRVACRIEVDRLVIECVILVSLTIAGLGTFWLFSRRGGAIAGQTTPSAFDR